MSKSPSGSISLMRELSRASSFLGKCKLKCSIYFFAFDLHQIKNPLSLLLLCLLMHSRHRRLGEFGKLKKEDKRSPINGDRPSCRENYSTNGNFLLLFTTTPFLLGCFWMLTDPDVTRIQFIRLIKRTGMLWNL